MRLDWEYRRDLATNPSYDPATNLYIPSRTSHTCSCGGNHRVDDVDWSGITAPVTFTYRGGTAGMGNSLLRGFQVADMLVTLGAPVPIRVQALENLYRARPKGQFLVVLKTAVRPKSEPVLKAFRRWNNTVFFDVIDGLVPNHIAALADGFICGSLTEQAARSQAGHRTILSLQSPDQRTPHFPFDTRPFSVVYYGLAENASLLDQLPDVEAIDFVDMPPHRSHQPVPDVFDSLKRYSHHYSVRAWNDRDGFKPMMKGYFAARLGAVAIASAQDEESRLVLGDDYPYLAPSSSLNDVRDAIDYARTTHGTEVWNQAVETMTRLRHESCPVATARALVEGLRKITS